MRWCSWKKRNRVLIVGYSPRLPSGVTKNTELLLRKIPYLELHRTMHCHQSRKKPE